MMINSIILYWFSFADSLCWKLCPKYKRFRKGRVQNRRQTLDVRLCDLRFIICEIGANIAIFSSFGLYNIRLFYIIQRVLFFAYMMMMHF